MTAMQADFLSLLAGILGILILASATGYVLKLRIAPDGSNATIENLNARILAWWGMVILLALAFLAGRGGVIVLFALVSFAALREFVTLATRRSADH